MLKTELMTNDDESFKGMRQLTTTNNNHWARSGKFMEQEETGRGLKKWSRGHKSLLPLLSGTRVCTELLVKVGRRKMYDLAQRHCCSGIDSRWSCLCTKETIMMRIVILLLEDRHYSGDRAE